MSTFVLNEKVKFILPAGYEYDSYPGESGRMVHEIRGGTQSECTCGVSTISVNSPASGIKSGNFLQSMLEGKFSSSMILPGSPRTAVAAVIASLAEVLGVQPGRARSGGTESLLILSALVQTNSFELTLLTASAPIGERTDTKEVLQHLCTVLGAMRVNGRKLPVSGLTPEQLMQELGLSDAPVLEEFRHVSPGLELYPHYNSLRNAGGSFGGITVVVNASGTEYAFIPLKSLAESGDSSSDNAALFRRIVAKDTEAYDLDRKAKEMQPLFHVNSDAFDPHHDRECELEQGLMQRASLMSALRSFAWTLADHCEKHSCSPGQVDRAVLTALADFISQRDSLNYDGSSYCQGLCACSDLHVFYVPDKTAKADKDALLPSQEDRDRARRMKETFPNYREILDQVHSLNALRKDLAYLYPAVKKLWEHLRESRDYSKALLGSEADIVYAWCALALAAKGPFFTEDGPTTCFFTQLPGTDVPSMDPVSEKDRATLQQARDLVSELGSQLEEGQTVIGSFSNYLEQKEAREKAAEEERARRKAEAMATGKSEKDVENMYIILTNEKKLGKLRRPKEEFFRIYEEDFAALSKTEVLKTRDALLKEMENDALCRIYADSFRQRPVKDRFLVSTRNLNNVSEEPEMAVKAEWAIENTREWYNPDEYAQVRQLMDAELADARKQLDDQLRSIDASWINYATARNFLQVVVRDKAADDSDLLPQNSNFQLVIGGQLVLVEIATKGLFKISVTVMNCFTWYWGVTVCEIWETALKNNLCDERVGAADGRKIAEKALRQIRAKFAEPKSASSGKTSPAASAAQAKEPAPAAAPKSDFWINGQGILQAYYGHEKDLILPDSVQAIGMWAFSDNTELSSVLIPEGVKRIEKSAFSGCVNLKKVILPASIQAIEEMAFWNCGLQSVTIPEGCKKIGDSCFGQCRELTEIRLPSTIRDIGVNAFETGNDDTVIHAPSNVKALVPDADAKKQPEKPAAKPQTEKTAAKPQPEKKEGCYIATAVYGDYDAPEVMTLRRFRDEILEKTTLGRWFIRTYYRLSPPVAAKLKNAKRINAFVRRLLDRWVIHLERKRNPRS